MKSDRVVSTLASFLLRELQSEGHHLGAVVPQFGLDGRPFFGSPFARTLLEGRQAADQRFVTVQMLTHPVDAREGQDLGGFRLGRRQEAPRVGEMFLNVLEVGSVKEVVLLEAAGLLDFHRVSVGPFQETKADVQTGEHEVGRNRDDQCNQKERQETQGKARPDSKAGPMKKRLSRRR